LRQLLLPQMSIYRRVADTCFFSSITEFDISNSCSKNSSELTCSAGFSKDFAEQLMFASSSTLIEDIYSRPWRLLSFFHHL
jgi:hypothetical protein